MKLEQLPLKEAYAIRRGFVDKFINKKIPEYRSVMGHGDFYGQNSHRGFLWEAIRPYNVLSRKIAVSLLAEYENLIVMWDDPLKHTSRSLQKSKMVKVNGAELSNELNNSEFLNYNNHPFFPKDFYVFDRELTFHITFTRVNIKGFGYASITSLNNLENTGVSPLYSELFENAGLGKVST